MKTILRAFILLACIALSISAGAVDIGKLKYTLNTEDLTATVTGLVGGKDAANGDLVIPEAVEYEGKKYSVTAIGKNAFYPCSGFTGSLTIGNSVTYIGEGAFRGCSGFTGNLTIPSSVKTIRYYAFLGCSGFTGNLTIGNSVTEIESWTFYGCSGFTGDLTIPNSVTSIGDHAFFGCSGFTGNLTIPESVTSIEECAFYGCSGFTGSLTIPNSVISIGEAAFSGCSGFNGSLTIGNSVTEIGEKAFYGCSGFTGDLTIPSAITSIGDDAFRGCSGFTGNLTIGNSVNTIGKCAFYGCSGFTGSLTIGNSVTEIGMGAFYDCSGFTGSLNIPNSVTSIGDDAFRGCSGFTGNLTIPNSVKTIGQSAFSRCSGFTGSLTIGNSVTEIESCAFSGCSGFTGSLTIPNSVTSIGIQAFSNCSGFTGPLTIPESIKKIENGTFEDCSGFTDSLTIPESVTSIGERAFSRCSRFTGLIIGEAVETIGSNAFGSCTALTEVKSLNPVPPARTGYYYDFFDYTTTGKAKLYVPDGSLEAYKTAEVWRNFDSIYPLSGSIKVTIGGITYEVIPGGGENGEDVVKVIGGDPDDDGTLRIPDEIEIDGNKYPVTEIGESAFKNHTDINKLIIPASVIKIGNEAFASCTNLSEVVAEDGSKILNCGAGAFKDASVEILYLGRDTSGKPFAGNSALTDLTIGEKVTSIGSGDFAGCGSIKNITVLAPNPPALADDAFDQSVYDTAVLRVPDESVEDYKAADGWKNFFDIMGINEIRPSEITIELPSMELIEGETATLKATITPENATNKTITWISSNSAVATVDANGLVIAIKPGNTTITATTANGLTAKCEVTVIAATIDATGLTLNREEAELIEGNVLQLNATIAPEDATDKTVTWSSSNSEVATVEANGLVTAIKPGKAIITATTANGLTAKCEVTVVEKPSGIDGVDSDGKGIVRVEGGEIVIEGDGKAEIFNISGVRVAVSSGGTVSGLPRGIYIVRIGGKKVKIKL